MKVGAAEFWWYFVKLPVFRAVDSWWRAGLLAGAYAVETYGLQHHYSQAARWIPLGMLGLIVAFAPVFMLVGAAARGKDGRMEQATEELFQPRSLAQLVWFSVAFFGCLLDAVSRS